MRSARAVVNTAPPEDFLHFHYNAKKCMQQAERLFDVERANRILLEKMTKYQEYNGAQHLRPWASRSTVNFKNGMLYTPGTGLHIDNLNVPVNNGTVAGGNRKTDYLRKQELETLAKENLRMRDKIKASRPVYSVQKLQHEYLENVSRIDRLSTFRGPSSASHRASCVKENMDVAKSMRLSQHRPGTQGYQKELARSLKQQRSQSARTSGRYGDSALRDSSGYSSATHAARPPTQGGTGIHAYVAEAARSMKRAATFSRGSCMAGTNPRRASSARATFKDIHSDDESQTSSRPMTSRPDLGNRPPLLTPDASVTMVTGEAGSRDGGDPERQPPASQGLLSHAPQDVLDV